MLAYRKVVSFVWKLLNKIMKNFAIATVFAFFCTNTACAKQAYPPKNDLPLRKMQSVLSKSTNINIQFAPFLTDTPEGLPINYVDKNSYISLQYTCHINCGRNATLVLTEILATAQWISQNSCKGTFFLGKVSLNSHNQELWKIYLGHNGNIINYNNECYYLETRLDPVMSSSGILLWNQKIKH